MENKIPNIYKLEIVEVVRESLSLYKNNYKLLLKISLLSFLISVIRTVLLYARTIFVPSTSYFITLAIALPIGLLLLYFEMKLKVTMYISISNCYSGKFITFREAFVRAKERVYSFIGISIVFGLIILPIALIGSGIFLSIEARLLKYLILLIFAIPLIYLGIKYQFAPLATVMEEGNENYFTLSERLVQNNFWRIALLMIPMVAIGNLPNLFTSNLNPWVKSLSLLYQNTISLSSDLVYVFISPAIACIIVVLYLTLRKKAAYKQV
ncbi:hypothetical protein SAMN05660297_02932 [Natronincola peptidivorans]|uniref:Glycerophosphoryl diester phosphodiesterase membrane domain-containing protein n=1 Tax=Natronincola peptidivorans TaxID=426128 RepID=A0A1I0FVF7_9FIRM|nr:hypothetical protein [Natronincola peptidivorans]SET61450.1 hypothetical protein SAMN05660297_02932 [Natronincola peptidivorans]